MSDLEEIKVEVLGTGGALSELPTSFLVEENLLIDAGYPIIQKIIKNKKIENIKFLFLTHLHMDHVSGIELLVYYLQFSNTNIKIFAGNDFMSFYKTLKCSTNVDGSYYQPFEFVDISYAMDKSNHFQFECEEVYLTAVKAFHMNGSVECFSFTVQKGFDNSFAKIIFSGDTDNPINTTEGLLENMNGFLFHDMGWTGLEGFKHIHKAHPTEKEVYDSIGYTNRIFGIHTDAELKYFYKAKARIYKF